MSASKKWRKRETQHAKPNEFQRDLQEMATLPPRSRVVQADGALTRYLKCASLFRKTGLDLLGQFEATAENVANGEGAMQLRADGACM